MNLPVNLWAASGEIGLIIAAPLVVLVLIGIKADRYLGTAPLFIIVAMLIAGTISAVAIGRKIKRLS